MNFCYKHLYLGSLWMVFNHSQDLTHLIYTMCIGFYVGLLLAQTGLCRADEVFPHLIQPSLLQRRQGIAVMCSSEGNHADTRPNREVSWRMSVVFSRHIQTLRGFPFATTIMLALFSNKNNKNKPKPNKPSFFLGILSNALCSPCTISKKIAVDII